MMAKWSANEVVVVVLTIVVLLSLAAWQGFSRDVVGLLLGIAGIVFGFVAIRRGSRTAGRQSRK